MSAAPLLHVSAFWVDGDKGDEIAELLAEFKMPGTKGATVTFSPKVANELDFRRTMWLLDLAEVNEHPAGDPE